LIHPRRIAVSRRKCQGRHMSAPDGAKLTLSFEAGVEV
jgi:hypothetical protein